MPAVCPGLLYGERTVAAGDFAMERVLHFAGSFGWQNAANRPGLSATSAACRNVTASRFIQ